ncbi:MAG: DUF2147 domain-containing protein [Oceanicaulis sp.]
MTSLFVLIFLLASGGAQDAPSPPEAQPAPVHGLWATSEEGGRVRIGPCGDAPEELCGELVDAAALRADPDLADANNPDPEQRSRPLRGVLVIDGFERSEDGDWEPGVLYDPEEGRRITNGHVRLAGPDRLEVRGCVAFICRTQVWTRIEDEI